MVGGPLFVFSGKAYVDSPMAFGKLGSSVLGVFILRGFVVNINDCLLTIDVDFRLSRITNKAKTTPIITVTQVPTVPPITDKLSNEEIDNWVVSSTHWYPSSQL